MMTTDNSGSISADEESYKDSPKDDNGKSQSQIDREEHDRLVKAEVAAPISESQVEPGQELVDGNGRRDTPDTEAVRPDILVDENANTQSKVDAQREHAQAVQDKQNAKLNQNTKPGTAPSDK